MRILVCIASLILAHGAAAAAEEGGPAKERVGPGKAVEAASQEEGIKLSEKAAKGLGLSFSSVTGSSATVPVTALVSFQDFRAVYRLRDGWFRLVEIEPRIQGSHASFSSKEIRPGDQLVVRGGSQLRVVELDIFGPEADACAD